MVCSYGCVRFRGFGNLCFEFLDKLVHMVHYRIVVQGIVHELRSVQDVEIGVLGRYFWDAFRIIEHLQWLHLIGFMDMDRNDIVFL